MRVRFDEGAFEVVSRRCVERVSVLGLLALFALGVGCNFEPPPERSRAESSALAGRATPRVLLRELRTRFVTELTTPPDPYPPEEPPRRLFELVRYPAPLGENYAYVTPARGERRPAIVWVVGGFDWGVGANAWEPASRGNDQSARAFREAGIVEMYPSLRGANGNPGSPECFFGEVDDVLAAADYLASRPDVDPERIYLGGHSTGGTLAMLAAESSDRFRAVFAFGPIDDPRRYDACLPADVAEPEAFVRRPLSFVDQIRTPTWVIEGREMGNTDSADLFARRRGEAPVTVLLVPGADHFNVLAPGTEAAAQAILADDGPTPHIELTVESILARGLAPRERF